MFKVGIIGCGLIGSKRAKSLRENSKLIACADIDNEKAKSFAKEHKVLKVFKSAEELVKEKDIDIVIISTLHDSLAYLTTLAILECKHVLVEKPAARSSSELLKVIDIAKNAKTKVHVGFNHRYHRAFQKAKSIIKNKLLGELMFIRARYGHGARLGYEKEWRADPKLSGGGELIDQGFNGFLVPPDDIDSMILSVSKVNSIDRRNCRIWVYW